MCLTINMPFSRRKQSYGYGSVVQIVPQAITPIMTSSSNDSDTLMVIQVSEGDLNNSDEPYQFFRSDGTLISDVSSVIERNKSYTFQRKDQALTHPFYVSDSGANQESVNLQITGDGEVQSGIKGSESFTITIDDQTESLILYCTSHPEKMQIKIPLNS